MSHLKPQVSFSLNFTSFFSVILHHHSETLYDLVKGTHQSAKFQTFNCSCEISPSLYFDKILLLKVYKISNYRGVMYHDTEE